MGDTIRQAVEYGLTVYEGVLITAIVALFGTIIWLAIYIKNLHAKQTKESSDHIKNTTHAMAESTAAIQNNTKAIHTMTQVVDKLYEHILKSVKK